MSREIRRVPKDWEHPRDDKGNYIPLNDEDYETAAKEWLADFLAFLNGTHKDQELIAMGCRYYWEWDTPPDANTYRERQWTAEEAACFQIYEDVSEGTPISPIFETMDELKVWLKEQGYSNAAVEGFAEDGWCPSAMTFVDKKDNNALFYVEGIECCAISKEMAYEQAQTS